MTVIALVAQPYPTLWDHMHFSLPGSLSITNSRSLLRLMPIESVMPSSHLIFCHPLLLLPPIPPSIRVFSNEPTLRMRWPKYSSVSFSISPSNEHPGLISFRMDWLLGASSCLSPSHRSTCRHVLLITSSNILPSTKTKYCVINFHFNCALGVYLCHWFSLNSLCSFLVWKLANIMDSLVYLN